MTDDGSDQADPLHGRFTLLAVGSTNNLPKADRTVCLFHSTDGNGVGVIDDRIDVWWILMHGSIIVAPIFRGRQTVDSLGGFLT